MAKNKLMPAQIILMVIIIVSFATIISATGYSLLLKKYPPVAIQPIVTPTITPEPDTSDWKTYKNENYGFEIKYPAKDWTISEYYGDIYIEYLNSDVRIIASASDYSAKQNMDNDLMNIPEGIRPKSEEILLNGIKGYKVENTELGEVQQVGGTLYLEKNSKKSIIVSYAYNIDDSSGCSNKGINCSGTMEKILSTFRFLK